MQQTTKYQFNLIEGGDNFSPGPLNENMEKVEEALAEQAKDFAAALGSGGSTCRIAYGSYTGTGTYGKNNACSASFDFRPIAVILCDSSSTMNGNGVLIRGKDQQTGTAAYIYTVWANNSVKWYSTVSAENQSNASGIVYYYVALGDNEA